MTPFYKRATPIIELMMIEMFDECNVFTSKSVRHKYSRYYMSKYRTPQVCFFSAQIYLSYKQYIFLFANKIVYTNNVDIENKLRQLFPGIRFI